MSELKVGDRVKVSIPEHEAVIDFVNEDGTCELSGIDSESGLDFVLAEHLTLIPSLPKAGDDIDRPGYALLDQLPANTVMVERERHVWVKQADGKWKGHSNFWSPRPAESSNFIGNCGGMVLRYVPEVAE